MTLASIPVPLGIAIVDKEKVSSSVIKTVLGQLPGVERVAQYNSAEAVFDAFERGEANALLINLFSVGVSDGLTVIEVTRGRFPHIPICLVGTNQQLITFPGVQGEFRARFQHYYRLPNDDSPHLIRRNAESVVERLASYLLARTASVKLRDLRELISQYRPTFKGLPEGSAHSIEETVELAERALEAKTTIGITQYIVPGFDGAEVQSLVKATLETASSGLKRTATVNIGILVVGAILILASFAVAVYKGSWEAVTFGGFGIAGVVASLITNPLKSIGLGARQLVQIQVAYLGFLNQLALLNRLPAEDNQKFLIERSRQLGEATTAMLAALERHFG